MCSVALTIGAQKDCTQHPPTTLARNKAAQHVRPQRDANGKEALKYLSHRVRAPRLLRPTNRARLPHWQKSALENAEVREQCWSEVTRPARYACDGSAACTQIGNSYAILGEVDRGMGQDEVKGARTGCTGKGEGFNGFPRHLVHTPK